MFCHIDLLTPECDFLLDKKLFLHGIVPAFSKRYFSLGVYHTVPWKLSAGRCIPQRVADHPGPADEPRKLRYLAVGGNLSPGNLADGFPDDAVDRVSVTYHEACASHRAVR